MKKFEYVNLKYKPKKEELICYYLVSPKSPNSIETVSSQIAAESSIGTWTEISTLTHDIQKRLSPHVYSISKTSNKYYRIKIAYPIDLFELGNIPQLLSAIAGNIFGMKILNSLRLENIYFPQKYIESFKGPLYGIEGIRAITGIYNRPFVGTIIKPKVGLTPKEHSKVAYEAWVGGMDIVKDDENLTNMSFNKFKERAKKTLTVKRKAEQKTGEKKLYLANVTSESLEMLKRLDYVKSLGGESVMIDILTAGFGALQTLRNNSKGLIIHAHRAMHAAFTRDPKQGISMLVIAKISRLAGIDLLHIGTAVGKMQGSESEVKIIFNEIEADNVEMEALKENWNMIKPTLAVSSGGLHPGHIPALYKIFGMNTVFQFGGGCHGHPNGTIAGAKAIRQALNASLCNSSLKDYAKSHIELAQALKKWG